MATRLRERRRTGRYPGLWNDNHARILAIAARVHRDRGGLVTTAELRAGSGLSPEGLHRHLRAMERDGELVRHGMGLWLPGKLGEL